MYAWLEEALQDASQVVTANRRLARTLVKVHAARQIEAGRSAWQSPDISAWRDWQVQQLDELPAATDPPVLVNAAQSRVLWERCLRREVSDPLLNVAMLVRQSQDAWDRLHAWRVPLAECVAAAAGRDQNIFASAAVAYQSILEREGWIDDAGLAAELARRIETAGTTAQASITLAGFDRYTPADDALLEALQNHGVRISRRPPGDKAQLGQLLRFDNPDAELRAAGAWARQLLTDRPGCRVGIVRTALEQDADRAAGLVREGLVPGWQSAPGDYGAAVNVSLGRRLGDWPLIGVAFTALRWIAEDIPSRDVSLLLRSAAIGVNPVTRRSALELELRDLPDRQWSPRSLSSVLGAADKHEGDARDFLQRVESISAMRSEMPQRTSPIDWAGLFNTILQRLNWPGGDELASDEFQLVNRWRELLNEFARLQIVIPTMTLQEALGRLRGLATDAIFQPESTAPVVDLLGPLEAAGLEFDALWLAGMSADNWPPSGRPSPLLSRQLQRDHGMPDADPDDTLGYAERVLQRLAASTAELVCSYPLSDGDNEQSASGLVDRIAKPGSNTTADPGWHANRLAGISAARVCDTDPVPAIDDAEKVSGGVGAIQRQFAEPFSAFAYGRLGVRTLQPISTGLSAFVRGRLVHKALWRLYRNFRDQQSLHDVSDQALDGHIADAIGSAFRPGEAAADAVLHELLQLEKKRTRRLLLDVVVLDRNERPYFEIDELETRHELVVHGVRFVLRIDRVDRLRTGELQVIDYKTGAAKALLGVDKEPKDMQLVAYSMALDGSVADLAYLNVDSRQVTMSGAGQNLTPDIDWDDNLARWQGEVETAVAELAAGDVRMLSSAVSDDVRTLGLLSRIREFERSAG